MSEVIPYLRTLAHRGFPIATRELASRVFRENPKQATRRVLDICDRHHARFTFFIVGLCARDNPEVIAEILDRGHEIACHGYRHVRYDLLNDDQACRDLEQAIALFDETFGYRLSGFRAPYLAMREGIYPLLRKLGFDYSSSTMSDAPGPRKVQDFPEIPIVVDDWQILIRDGAGMNELALRMKVAIRDGACLLLHPWRVGQTYFAPALDEVLAEASSRYHFPTMREFCASDQGAVALSGDIGELSWAELIRRALTGD